MFEYDEWVVVTVSDPFLMSGPEVSMVRRDAARCFDPECSGVAVPEQEWDTTYLVCDECGSEFGHRRVAAEPDCSRGVPEAVRRSVPSLAQHNAAVLLGMPQVRP